MSLCRSFSNPPVTYLARDKCRCRFSLQYNRCCCFIATILDKNLETLWIILLPFDFPLPFAMLLQPRNFTITSQHCRGKATCIGISWIFGEDCVRCKRPIGYHYTLSRRGGMLEETASVIYSVRCFEFKGFKFMTRISFLAIFTAQIFEN